MKLGAGLPISTVAGGYWITPACADIDNAVIAEPLPNGVLVIQPQAHTHTQKYCNSSHEVASFTVTGEFEKLRVAHAACRTDGLRV